MKICHFLGGGSHFSKNRVCLKWCYKAVCKKSTKTYHKVSSPAQIDITIDFLLKNYPCRSFPTNDTCAWKVDAKGRCIRLLYVVRCCYAYMLLHISEIGISVIDEFSLRAFMCWRSLYWILKLWLWFKHKICFAVIASVLSSGNLW